MTTATANPPRTLADQLRSWSDEQLTRLLEERSDLGTPSPHDSSQLASRVGTRASVLRALDQLSQLDLTVLDAAVALGGTTSAHALRDAVNADSDKVDRSLDRLRGLCLLWGDDDSLRSLHVLADILGTRISRLGPPVATLLAAHGPTRVQALVRDLGLRPTGDRHEDVAMIAAHLDDHAVVAALVADVDERAAAILDHLDREGKDGTVETTERSTSRGSARGPIDQLLARGLLVARDRRHVVVPREVSMCLRGGHTTRERADEEPALATGTRDQALVDRTASGAALELVRHTEVLLDQWGVTPPSALRTGGLGVRELKAAAALLHLDERVTALHIEIACAADLLAVGTTSSGDSAWLPTRAVDRWTAISVAEQWAVLAAAWLESPRMMGLVGARENAKPVNALMPDLERAWLPETRSAALKELGGLPAGTVLATGTGTSSLVDRMAWLRPRRPAMRAQAVSWALEESTVVGMTALGGLARHGRELLEGTDPEVGAAAALLPLLPEPVDHVMVQADLTAIAPGMLERDLGRRLATAADVESRGGATVYRFTESSLRRAFDSGWSAAEVHDLVATASRTPVPQALSYLVDDVARRFGTIRVGVAEVFLRSDDEAALAQLLHDQRASSLRLRRIAPTVLVSDVPIDILMPRLRDLGAAPVVEAADGTVQVARRDALRAETPRQDRLADARSSARGSARVAATVTAVRAGDRAASSRPESALRTTEPATPAATLAVLRESVEAGSTVWIGYVDNHGSTVERIVDPLSVEAGWLSAYDHRTEGVRTFAVHRVTAVRRLEP